VEYRYVAITIIARRNKSGSQRRPRIGQPGGRTAKALSLLTEHGLAGIGLVDQVPGDWPHDAHIRIQRRLCDFVCGLNQPKIGRKSCSIIGRMRLNFISVRFALRLPARDL
jgi:hypothetical protein